jgi:ribosome maturation factor RimP
MEFEIKDKIEDFISASNYFLIDYVIKGDKNNKIIEIYVDSKSGVNVDELGKLNHGIWDVLKKEEMTDKILKIIVSSPGTDKPVKFFWQLEKHIGRKIQVRKGESIVQGILKEMIEKPEGNFILVEFKKGKGKKLISENTEFIFGDEIEINIIPGF